MQYPLYDARMTCEPFDDNSLTLYRDGVKIAHGLAESLETEKQLNDAAVAILNQIYSDQEPELIGATRAAETLGMKRPTLHWTVKTYLIRNYHYYIIDGAMFLKPNGLEALKSKVKDGKA